MKVAIASFRGEVAAHFGFCESFVIFEVENGLPINKSEIPNPGHRPGFLPDYLANLGIEVMIAGGIGANAVTLFEAKKIEVVTGASGLIAEVIKKFIANTLKSTDEPCVEHRHHDDC